MSMTLVALPQITPPPNRESNAALLQNIAVLSALNPKERLALAVYFRAKELANDTTNPLTNYDPAIVGDVQDAKTVMGSIPVGDLPIVALAIDWANSKSVYAALPSDVDTLRGLLGHLARRDDDELRRILLYLRLEIAS
jgi:hypothetical protein